MIRLGVVLVLVAAMLSTGVVAIPVPYGIDGTIYDLDMVTPVGNNVNFTILNVNSGFTISGQTGIGASGRYAASLVADIGDEIRIDARNRWNTANISVILTGTMHNVDFVLNMTQVPFPPEIRSDPGTEVELDEDEIYDYQIDAYDENQDVLTYRLLNGPPGMTINTGTGLVELTARDIDVGTHVVSLQVEDGLHFANQSYNMTVNNINDAPVVTSIPPGDAYQDQPYQYLLTVFDDDEDDVDMELTIHPDNMSFEESTNIISWIPHNSDVGNHTIEMYLTDGEEELEYTFNLTVLDVNDSPVFVSVPVVLALEDQLYTYAINVTDEENDELSYSLVTSPGNMTINDSTGVVSWVPVQADVGFHVVTIAASDGAQVTTQSYSLQVQNVNDVPYFTSQPITQARIFRKYTYNAVAFDEDNDTIKYDLPVHPSGMHIDQTTGTITWRPRLRDRGIHEVVVSATDGVFTINQSYNLSVAFRFRFGRLDRIDRSVTETDDTLTELPAPVFAPDIQSFNKKPRDVRTPDRAVHRYLFIEFDTDQRKRFSHEFSVSVDWLESFGVDAEDVTLALLDGRNIDEIATEIVKHGKNRITYTATVDEIGYYAITVKQGVTATLAEPTSSTISVPYRIGGIFYRNGLRAQVARGTRYTVTNLATGDVERGRTGIGPNNGGYLISLVGTQNDPIELQVRRNTFQTRLDDIDDLDLFLQQGGGMTRITGNVIGAVAGETDFFAAVVFIALLLAATIYIKMRRRT